MPRHLLFGLINRSIARWEEVKKDFRGQRGLWKEEKRQNANEMRTETNTPNGRKIKTTW